MRESSRHEQTTSHAGSTKEYVPLASAIALALGLSANEPLPPHLRGQFNLLVTRAVKALADPNWEVRRDHEKDDWVRVDDFLSWAEKTLRGSARFHAGFELLRLQEWAMQRLTRHGLDVRQGTPYWQDASGKEHYSYEYDPDELLRVAWAVEKSSAATREDRLASRVALEVSDLMNRYRDDTPPSAQWEIAGRLARLTAAVPSPDAEQRLLEEPLRRIRSLEPDADRARRSQEGARRGGKQSKRNLAVEEFVSHALHALRGKGHRKPTAKQVMAFLEEHYPAHDTFRPRASEYDEIYAEDGKIYWVKVDGKSGTLSYVSRAKNGI
ncbi:MAG: hypothetical protein QNJ82_07360 [Gammaproteobacteria bacterium]|nr:hypothetical protein [Gammaproteobacteria bacterium]